MFITRGGNTNPIVNDFGKGLVYTTEMITGWNKSYYGTQDSKDIWGHIQDKYAKGWFVPSISEWAAFGSAFEITSDNYEDFGLIGNIYWSSTPHYIDNCAYYIFFGENGADYQSVYTSHYVRLTVTF